MTSQTRATLYTYFQTGDTPTQQQFANLIDSNLNLATTSAQSITSNVSANGVWEFTNSFIVGAPTGGNKGVGTVNATGLYVNGTLITTTSAGGSGTVNVGVSGQVAYYASNSNSVSGTNALPGGLTAPNLRFTTTTGLIGTTTNDSAAAGSVGEYQESKIASGSAISITTGGVAQNITTLSLTAGDWDVWANIYFVPAASTILNGVFASVGTTSSTIDGTPGNFTSSYTGASGSTMSTDFSPPTVMRRISIAITTTIYLVGLSNFTTSTLTAYGGIFARRVR